MTSDAGLKSTPSTSKPSEEDAQPHDDDDIEITTVILYFITVFLNSKMIFCFGRNGCNALSIFLRNGTVYFYKHVSSSGSQLVRRDALVRRF